MLSCVQYSFRRVVRSISAVSELSDVLIPALVKFSCCGLNVSPTFARRKLECRSTERGDSWRVVCEVCVVRGNEQCMRFGGKRP